MSIRPPVPKNKILLFTLVGALLTGAVAVGLAYPGFSSTGDDGNTQAAEGGSLDTSADAPEPNQDFTPQVANGGYEEHEEYYEDDDEYEENGEEDEYEEEEEGYGEYEDDEEYEDEDDDDGYEE